MHPVIQPNERQRHTMRELDPLTLQEVPSINRLNINDLLYQSPLNSDMADQLYEAVDKADDLADEILDTISDVRSIADGIEGDMSLPVYKEIEGHLDRLCDLRDDARTALEKASEAEQFIEAQLAEDDGSSSRDDVLQEITASVGSIEELFDVADQNVQAISNFIDQ